MKIAAAALAVLMFFLSGYSAGLFLKGYFLFNGYDEGCDFTQTNSFRMLLNNCEFTLLADAELMSCENEDDFLKTSLGKNYSQNIQNVNDAFDLLESSGVRVYVTEDNRYRYSYDLGGTTYYFSYNGDVISRDEFDRYDFVGDGIEYTDAVEATEPAAEDVDSTSVTKPVPAKSGNPKPIDDIRDALALLNSFGGYTCYGEISREDLIKTIRKSTMQHRGVYEDGGKITFYSTSIPSTSEFKYTILVKSTGKVVSNCGIDSDIGFDNVYEAMREGAALAEGNNGKFVTTAEPSETTRGGLLREWAEELFYQKPTVSEHRSIGDDVSYAVFTYTPTDENSFFTLKELEFENYKSHFITNPTTNLIISVFSFLLACAACVYLLCVAGKTADGETKLCPTDRIPLLINTAIIGGIIALVILGFAAIFDAEYEFYPSVGESSEWFLMQKTILTYSVEYLGVAFAAVFGLLIALTASIVRNVRCRTFLRHTLIYWIVKPFVCIGKKITKRLKYIFACDYMSGSGKRFKRLAIILTLTFFLINFLAMLLCLTSNSAVPLVIPLMIDLPIMLWVILFIASLDRIMHGVASVRLGRLNVRIDQGLMPSFLRNFARDITSMQDGLEKAVDSAVKDQRMKAELITNVSHDLKTPLTSIVNYVDLLKRCNVEDEDAKKYISILDEKSQKMKKLIEDLVEASKASSGAVELHPIKIDLCEFAAQAVGEHEDELKEKNIELVLNFHARPVMIIADAQKTSRIVENLFSNLRKYALEGTRVYIDVNGGDNFGTLTFRNISKFPLNIAPEELTQRFVRGDASRSGEGSGLGLSIANDLCELQGGKFNIAIDGDLFKVSIAMPKAQ